MTYKKVKYPQKEVLKKIKRGVWYSAYNLQVSIATLRALVKKGILESKSGLGSLFDPRSNVMFRLR